MSLTFAGEAVSVEAPRAPARSGGQTSAAFIRMFVPSEYRPGSRSDFDRLYQETYPRIFRTLTAVLGDPAAAEDCTQEAFVKAFRAWPRWKADAPAEAWIHRIALNTAFTHMRRQRLREISEIIRRLGRPVEDDPTEPVIGPDVIREIRRLPARQAAVLVLRHLHGYTNREIASSLGVPESTIASRLMAAKRTLRERLADHLSGGTVTSPAPPVPPVPLMRVAVNSQLQP